MIQYNLQIVEDVAKANAQGGWAIQYAHIIDPNRQIYQGLFQGKPTMQYAVPAVGPITKSYYPPQPELQRGQSLAQGRVQESPSFPAYRQLPPLDHSFSVPQTLQGSSLGPSPLPALFQQHGQGPPMMIVSPAQMLQEPQQQLDLPIQQVAQRTVSMPPQNAASANAANAAASAASVLMGRRGQLTPAYQNHQQLRPGEALIPLVGQSGDRQPSAVGPIMGNAPNPVGSNVFQ